MAGHVTPAGLFVTVGAARLPLPATAQTVREWVERAADVWPDLCEQCGELVCECIPPDAWAALLERINADPHALNNLDGLDIPY